MCYYSLKNQVRAREAFQKNTTFGFSFCLMKHRNTICSWRKLKIIQGEFLLKSVSKLLPTPSYKTHFTTGKNKAACPSPCLSRRPTDRGRQGWGAADEGSHVQQKPPPRNRDLITSDYRETNTRVLLKTNHQQSTEGCM